MNNKKENERIYYDLNQSQIVVSYQCMFSLYKQVINIMMSAESEDEIDFDIMKEAFNKVVERNDCLRIRFCKRNKKLVQYFLPEDKFENIPVLKFETQKEQERFVNRQRNKAIKYKKGHVVEPYFIRTYDGKSMIFLKVCHLILDLYGLNIIYNDLFAVYDALKNNTPLPVAPGSFEEVLKKDLKKNDEVVYAKQKEFFENLFGNNPEPYYAGISGNDNKYVQKYRAKGKKYLPMFLINNQSKTYTKDISPEYVLPLLDYCKQHNTTLSNFLFYTNCLTLSKIDNNLSPILPLELCNCRGTLQEKQCAGTKAQSIKGSYMIFDGNKSFDECVLECAKMQNNLFRYVNFKDQDLGAITHKFYKSPFLSTYYPMTFSYVPFTKPKGVKFQLYSNGRFVLPAYVALTYDENSNHISAYYDCQVRSISQQNVERFHNAYLQIIKQVCENPGILLKDIKVSI